MEHSTLLSQLLLVLAMAVGVVFVFSRLKQPSIVGLLVTGILVGPSDPAAARLGPRRFSGIAPVWDGR